MLLESPQENLATLFRAQAVKYFAHRFLNISCSGWQGGELFFFYLVNLNLVSRPMWTSDCKKVCCQKPLNWTKTMILLSNPLKNDPQKLW